MQNGTPLTGTVGSLRDFELPVEHVELAPGYNVPVRGLGFSAISSIVRKHLASATLVFNEVVGATRDGKDKESADAAELGLLIETVMEQAPELVAEIIAYGMGEPDQAGKVKDLRIGVQMDAVEKIFALTFQSESEVKKLVADITRWMQGMSGVLGDLNNSPSTNGFGASAGK